MKFCPRCQLPMERAGPAGAEIWACRGCGGCWADEQTAPRMLADIHTLGELDRRYGASDAAAAADALSRYCPVCPATPLQFPDSDAAPWRCPQCHGSWLEPPERARLLGIDALPAQADPAQTTADTASAAEEMGSAATPTDANPRVDVAAPSTGPPAAQASAVRSPAGVSAAPMPEPPADLADALQTDAEPAATAVPPSFDLPEPPTPVARPASIGDTPAVPTRAGAAAIEGADGSSDRAEPGEPALSPDASTVPWPEHTTTGDMPGGGAQTEDAGTGATAWEPSLPSLQSIPSVVSGAEGANADADSTMALPPVRYLPDGEPAPTLLATPDADLRCPRCLRPYPGELATCPVCGCALVEPDFHAICPHCGVANPLVAEKCSGCNEPLRSARRLEELYPPIHVPYPTGAPAGREPTALTPGVDGLPPVFAAPSATSTSSGAVQRWCPTCRTAHPADQRQCPRCGAPLVAGGYPVRCGRCNAENAIAEPVCRHCRAPLHAAGQDAYLPTPPPPLPSAADMARWKRAGLDRPPGSCAGSVLTTYILMTAALAGLIAFLLTR